MDSYVAIGIFVIIVMEVGGLIVLGMQLRAYRHHRHPSLLVLSLSSVIGLAYGAVASLGYFVHDPGFSTHRSRCSAPPWPSRPPS